MELLEDLARGSLGCACPSRAWLARRLDCPLRTLDRWTAELRAKGYIAVTKRQHAAALYTVLQTCQNDKSGDKSGGKSERRYIGRVKRVEESFGVPVYQSKPKNPEPNRILPHMQEELNRWLKQRQVS
jgi:hypothetical protein